MTSAEINDINDINEIELYDLIETILILIYDIVEDNPFIYSNPKFNEYLFENVMLIIDNTFDNEIGNTYSIEDIIYIGIDMFDGILAPARSYNNNIITDNPDINNIKKQIEYLENIPQPDQRTNEWYIFRHRYLTASSIWKAFGSQKSKNELIYSKCKPLNLEKYESVNLNSPLHWGQKYEPISIQWYEREFNTKISDFGCLPHANISYLAASPDGINTDPSSNLYGRMLEVKNIVNREIDGNPKFEYWIQMQFQMEVCNLEQCDFLETKFTEYDSYNDFINDGEYTKSNDNKYKGFFVCFSENGKPLYEYAPFGATKDQHNIWEKTILEKHNNLTWVQNIYWKLNTISCVLVLRNSYWFNNVIPELNELWETIEYEKKNGYTHRAPDKKQNINIIKSNKCQIDTQYISIQTEIMVKETL